MATAALAYHEPGIVTILVQASFLILLNIINWILDNAIYCGLLGQVFVGIAWGVPGANWLSLEVQDTVMQLGYLGLILIVYEGGLSTSFALLLSNLYLSGTVALVGVGVPIGLSFILQRLINATPVQAFAAGAALCSTSLGTTFTILSTSGLDKSRLGVILSSAAMLDDVAGLVMVQVISNLGSSAGSFDSTTVIRPVFVSIAFAVVVPLVCRVVVQPLTKYLLVNVSKDKAIRRSLSTPAAAYIAHTLLLVALVTGSTYAGTSNLFAAYIAGAVVNWWDALVLAICDIDAGSNAKANPKTKETQGADRKKTQSQASSPAIASSIAQGGSDSRVVETQPHDSRLSNVDSSQLETTRNPLSGVTIYERFYGPAVKFILKPFFFASIGFAIPITQMFHGAIFWRGIVYTMLMIVGKLVTGLVLVRFTGLPDVNLLPHFLRRKKMKAAKKDESLDQTAPAGNNMDSARNDRPSAVANDHADEQPRTSTANISRKRAVSSIPKPQSLYPAAMLGSAMVARGEIGFLISSLAESTGVFGAGSDSTGGSSEIFLVATWAILLCTVIGPVSVGVMVKRVKRLQTQERSMKTGRPDPLGIWGLM